MIAASGVFALIAGVSIGYEFGKQTLLPVLANRNIVIDTLRHDLEEAKESLQQVPATVAQYVPPPAIEAQVDEGDDNSVLLEYSLPKRGENYCRGDLLTLSWKADAKHADEVRVSVNAPFPMKPIADVPVTWNEAGAEGEGTVHWEVGTGRSDDQAMNIPDGALYRISMDVLDHGTIVGSADSELFAITTCQG